MAWATKTPTEPREMSLLYKARGNKMPQEPWGDTLIYKGRGDLYKGGGSKDARGNRETH